MATLRHGLRVDTAAEVAEAEVGFGFLSLRSLRSLLSLISLLSLLSLLTLLTLLSLFSFSSYSSFFLRIHECEECEECAECEAGEPSGTPRQGPRRATSRRFSSEPPEPNSAARRLTSSPRCRVGDAQGRSRPGGRGRVVAVGSKKELHFRMRRRRSRSRRTLNVTGRPFARSRPRRAPNGTRFPSRSLRSLWVPLGQNRRAAHCFRVGPAVA